MKNFALLTSVAAVALAASVAISNAQQGGAGPGVSNPSTSSQENGASKISSPAVSVDHKNRPNSAAEAPKSNGNRAATGDQKNMRTGSASANEKDVAKPNAKDQQGKQSSSTATENNNNKSTASGDQEKRGSATADGKTNSKQNAAATRDMRNGASAEDEKNAGNHNGPTTGRSAVSSQGGQHDAGATNITTEERGRIHSEISHVNIKEARDINVHVSIGAAVPRTITKYWEPVPTEIVTIVPAWRSYRVVKIHGDLLIIDPDTYKIVYVIAG